jgi:peptide/nickel transport system permease protein
LTSAYFGGVVDDVLSLVINVFLVLPGLPLTIVLASLATANSVNKNEFVIALVASNFLGTFVYTVGAEVALEFLGLGDTSKASWGVILYWAQTNSALLTGQWWLFVPAGLCVAVLCAGLAFINFGIDEVANPRLRSERPPRKRLLSAKKKAVA